MENMTLEEVKKQELLASGSSKTNNDQFEKDGYLVVKDLWNSEELFRPIPELRGSASYWGKQLDQFKYNPVESQVEGSFSTYWHPQYRQIHSGIRLKLEKIIGSKLYNTYYYDRFYFTDQELAIHTDRAACEISVTIHISSNLEQPWPIWIKTPNSEEKIGEERSVTLSPGDGMIYKGCERPHWRNKMPEKFKKTWYGRRIKDNDVYYHQVFFHYVLANGNRVQCANDMAK
jgi:hypothetical protein|tara:strand:+ start:1279 stop:1971 length:693 start_codon:yes stop_codon:yes gene_type:complete